MSYKKTLCKINTLGKEFFAECIIFGTHQRWEFAYGCFTLGKDLSFSHFQPQNILNQVKFEMQLIQIMEYNK